MTITLDDLMAPDAIDDPHAYSHRLRDEDPVHWNERWEGWVITRYDDVVNVLRDADRFSSDRMAYLESELSPGDRERFAPIFDVLSPEQCPVSAVIVEGAETGERIFP